MLWWVLFPRRRKKTTFFENLDKISTNFWKTIKWKQNVHTNDKWFQLQFWNDLQWYQQKQEMWEIFLQKPSISLESELQKRLNWWFFLGKKDTALFKSNALCDLWGFHRISYRQIFDIFAAIKYPELLNQTTLKTTLNSENIPSGILESIYSFHKKMNGIFEAYLEILERITNKYW